MKWLALFSVIAAVGCLYANSTNDDYNTLNEQDIEAMEE